MKSLISLYIEYQAQIIALSAVFLALILWRFSFVRRIGYFFANLPNKLLALLMLLVLVPAIGGALYYIFALNTGSLEVQVSGGSDVTIGLKRSDVNAFERVCADICRFENIPAGSYDVMYS